MTKRSLLIIVLTLLSFAGVAAQPATDVKVTGSVTPAKVKKGRVVRAVVTLDIPAGLHVQSNRPLDKFLIATNLDVEAPQGLQVGPVSYPRAVLRTFNFSKNQVAVYEGRAMIRFNITVPPNYSGGSADIRARLRFQACNNNSCFPPVTRDVEMSLNVQ